MARQEKYVLFIDESGKADLHPHSDIRSRYLLLSGLIINKDLHTALSSYMISMKEKVGIPTIKNIHAFDLFENEDEKIPFQKINIFFKRLCSLIEGTEIRSRIVYFDKKPYTDLIRGAATNKGRSHKAPIAYLQRKGGHDFIYEGLARKLILEFGQFLEKEDAQGEIIAESRRLADKTIIDAFNSSTTFYSLSEDNRVLHKGTFSLGSRYDKWAKHAFKRINSLTFQNKKGLSFGLEVADLFAWGAFNFMFGLRKNPGNPMSTAQFRRVRARLERTIDILKKHDYKRGIKITPNMLNGLAGDRVSEFTKALTEFLSPRFVPSGTPPRTLGGPY